MQDTKHLVEQAIEALMAGERPRAREILQMALKQDPRNEQGWLALSFAVDKPEHALECVQRVLALNPQHEKARERLEDLQASAGTSTAPQAQPRVQALVRTSAAPQIQPPAGPPPSQAAPAPAQWATESDALQAKSEYFFFEPEAERFVRGETQTLPLNSCLLLALGAFALSGLLISGLSVIQWVHNSASETSSGGLGLLCGNLFWWAIVLGLAYYVLGQRSKRQRLSREGTLIDGAIVQCSGHLDSDNDFQVKADIRFRSPQTGQWVFKTFSRQCNHLKGNSLPSPGTPIHILYIDDRTFDGL
jgi:hypothetical protein